MHCSQLRCYLFYVCKSLKMLFFQLSSRGQYFQLLCRKEDDFHPFQRIIFCAVNAFPMHSFDKQIECIYEEIGIPISLGFTTILSIACKQNLINHRIGKNRIKIVCECVETHNPNRNPTSAEKLVYILTNRKA